MQQNNSIYWSWRSAQHVSDKTTSIIRSVRLQITACSMVCCCSGGLAVRRASAWYYVLGVKESACGIFLHTKHIGPGCRPPDRQPTTTTGHHTTSCNLQSYAPEDGQKIARNMLSWSWRSINSVIFLYLVGFSVLLCRHYFSLELPRETYKISPVDWRCRN
jgi:hypothetical protein